MRYIKHYLAGIEGVEIFPILSFFIFLIVFIGFIVFVFRMDKNKLTHIKNLPFENKPNKTGSQLAEDEKFQSLNGGKNE